MANTRLKKLEVLIDANAFSHLSKIEINRRKADKWLWKYLHVFTCTAVKNEFAKHLDWRPLEHTLLYNKFKIGHVHSVRKLNKLEQNWLHSKYYRKLSLKKKDKGERHLICTAVELVKKKKIEQLIIITDDYTARIGFMNNVLEDIPFGQIWNTPDLLSYLYYVNDDISYEVAENAIIDIIPTPSMSWKKFKKDGDTENDAMIRMRTHYINKIRQIRFLKQKYHS